MSYTSFFLCLILCFIASITFLLRFYHFLVQVPLDEVYEDWKKTIGPLQIKDIAEHYGVFDDLFGDAYFIPSVIMDISYKSKEGFVPVFRGNDIKPSQVALIDH